ncbi:MAG: hypothetical protein WD489_07275 [Rhodovibrionaceae bacterium]
MLRFAGTLAIALALAACTAPEPTRYQQSESGEEGFGYSEKWLDEATYEVRFAGNRLTERQTVENYTLFRAAELAREKGYQSFALLERTVEENTTEKDYYDSPGYYGSPFHYGPYGWGHPYHYHPSSFGYPGYLRSRHGAWPPRRVTQTTFAAVATVALFTGTPPEEAVKTYDAATILQELGPEVVRPEPAEN